jgi:chemotaxis methyl-accepting protein methylase
MRTERDKPTHVVGIGGSAGGLEAFEQFFSHMPVDSGMAFVVVQHMDPVHKAMLSELLQRITDMNVASIETGMRVEPNRVYVIAPNRDVAIVGGVLQLLEPSAPRGLWLPIDFFLRSLAEDQGERSVAIILSGMGTDGTLGLKAIKEKLGMAMAQDIASAKFGGMPRSAIETGLVDHVEPADRLPATLVDYGSHGVRAPRRAREAAAKAAPAMQRMLAILKGHTGHDFSLYKKETLMRRIKRRMSVHLLDKTTDYVKHLQENPREIELLFKELLIGVTNFFRNPEAYDALKKEMLAHLEKNGEPGRGIRAWVVGCSTGEEAYSIAIAIKECVDAASQPGGIDIQVFATDIDKDAIEIARRGFYDANIAADVSQERLRTTVEEMEASQEELQAANEELHSARQDGVQQLHGRAPLSVHRAEEDDPQRAPDAHAPGTGACAANTTGNR